MMTKQDQIGTLQRSIKREVDREEYLWAAKYRDELNELIKE